MDLPADDESVRVCKAMLKMIQLKTLPPEKVEEYVSMLQKMCGVPRSSDLLALDDCGILQASSLNWDTVTAATCLPLLVALLDAECTTSLLSTIAAHLYYGTNMEQAQSEFLGTKILNSEGDIPVCLVELVAVYNPLLVEKDLLASLLVTGNVAGAVSKWYLWCSQSPQLFRRASGLLCRTFAIAASATDTAVTKGANQNATISTGQSAPGSTSVDILAAVAQFASQVRARCNDQSSLLRLYPQRCRAIVALLQMTPSDTFSLTACSFLVRVDPASRLTLLTHFPNWVDVYADYISNSKAAR